MHIDERQHPDELSDWCNFKNISTGSKQALEDAALNAYFAILDAGGTIQQAQDAFFNNHSHAKGKTI